MKDNFLNKFDVGYRTIIKNLFKNMKQMKKTKIKILNPEKVKIMNLDKFCQV